MKKKIFTFFCCLLSVTFLQAQTWNGSAGTDWNTAANWNTNAVPLATGDVIIPNTVNKPVLANNVIVNSFSMSVGSGLDFNGFTLTSNAAFDINGATLTNSNGATDISITLNGAGALYLRQSVINDHIIINHNGTSGFLEGYQFPNTFNGNATFNISTNNPLYTSFDNASTYNGNVTVNRTVAGTTEIFRSGAVAVTGNFSYTNIFGGNTLIHQFGTVKVPITGTVNITATGAGNPTFSMERIQNNTTGGTISVQNSDFVNIAYDTLLLSALNVNGYTGFSNDDFLQNQITGTVNISDAASNNGTSFFRKNTINGTTTITINSGVPFWEGYQFPNTFNGNTTFICNGTGGLSTSYDNASTYNGNVTINRTVAGITEIFRVGAVAVTGNFSYTNNAGGSTAIHPVGTVKVPISGTVNITATGAGNPAFSMERIQNNTTGGTISVQNSDFVNIAYDTLLLSALNVNGYTGFSNDDFLQNQITGTVNISDAAGNNGTSFFRRNTINGNTTITINSGVPFWEGYQFPNTFNGNTTFICNGTGSLYTSFDNASTYNGNVTVNRTVAGTTEIFRVGAVAVTGDFSYTNNAGGSTAIHPVGTVKVPISGTVNITATGAGNPAFSMERIQNNTTGGTISVQNSGPVTILNDTLLLAALNVNGFTQTSNDEMRFNVITGNVTFSDAAANGGFVLIGSNTINGNTTLSANGAIPWLDGYLGSDVYNGNVTFNRNAGTITLASSDTTYINGDLIFNATAGISITNALEFGGSTNTSVEQSGIQPISIPILIMKKTGGSRLTLNDPVTVTTTATFTSGNIFSSTTNDLIFSDNATHAGASNASYTDGPVTKIGTQAFTFPVGNMNYFAPVSISAPSLATDAFRTQYFLQHPNSGGYDVSQKDATLHHISKQEYWLLDRATGSSNVFVTLSWDASRSGVVNNMPDLRVARWNGSLWKDEGNGATTGTNALGTVMSLSAVTNFSPFSLASSTPLNPLPVHLVSFAAAKCNSSVCLLWVTENEQNFSHFEAEKSSDGRNFVPFITVAARNTAGRNTYTSTDINPVNGDNFYRLKMVDIDGTIKYSNIIKVNLDKPEQVSLLPNPASGFILLKGVSDYKLVKIIDLAGKVKQQHSIRKSIEEIDVSRLPAGMYIVQLQNDSRTTSLKLIKQ